MKNLVVVRRILCYIFYEHFYTYRALKMEVIEGKNRAEQEGSVRSKASAGQVD